MRFYKVTTQSYLNGERVQFRPTLESARYAAMNAGCLYMEYARIYRIEVHLSKELVSDILVGNFALMMNNTPMKKWRFSQTGKSLIAMRC